MKKNKQYSRASEYFKVLNLNKVHYQLILKVNWIESLARFSPLAAEKILRSEFLKEATSDDGEVYWYLDLEKKYSICVHELQESSGELSAEDMITYNLLTKELLETGYSPEEAQQTIFQPLNWEHLNDKQKTQAQSIFVGFAAASGSKTNNATIVLKRAVKDWTSVDTGYLHSEMVEELLSFYENEQQGWNDGVDDSEKEALNPRLITVPEKLAV